MDLFELNVQESMLIIPHEEQVELSDTKELQNLESKDSTTDLCISCIFKSWDDVDNIMEAFSSLFINDSFIDDEKYKILAKLAGSLILHNEYLLAERLGNIKITIALDLVLTSNNISLTLYQDSTQYLTNDTTDNFTSSNVDNAKNSDNTSYQLHVTFVQQQYNDKEELDLEKYNGKVLLKISTNYGKNRSQNNSASDMEDIIAIPALDFNNQSEILIDVLTV
ncbi:hypothetical protein C1646_769026 [Rhizophagus diaphanus]|nr:hypothetical protein C1646_769026 [Rhizophagus diaphanus] [Rhizophagus sp. MUCL 43196]